MLDIAMAARSEPGLRTTNEDALRVGRAGDRHYAVLADGAGGHDRGAEAARRVVERVAAALAGGDAAPPFDPAWLERALLDAHEELQAVQRGAQGRRRRHATAVVLWLDGAAGEALWSHVGDSRLYRFRGGAVECLTADDSVVGRMVESGVLTPRQALDHPLRNHLLAALGMAEAIEPHTRPAAAVGERDAFLLCTDGWWSTLDEAEMADALAAAATPQHWLDAMAGSIASRGSAGQDNFSAVAAWVGGPAGADDGATAEGAAAMA